MKNVFFFVFVYIFYGLPFVTSDSVACYNGGPGNLTTRPQCKFCGFHGYSDSCKMSSQTTRYCLTFPILHYDDSNGLRQNYTDISESCFTSYRNGCVETLMICDADYCNFDCPPDFVSSSPSPSFSSSTAFSSSPSSSSSTTTTTPLPSSLATSTPSSTASTTFSSSSPSLSSSSSLATSTISSSSESTIQFSVALIAFLVAVEILVYA